MTWKARGDERGKSYRVYQELLKEYEGIKRYNAYLVEQMQRKDQLIGRMADEIGRAVKAYGPETMATTEPVGPAMGQSEYVERSEAPVSNLVESETREKTMPVHTGHTRIPNGRVSKETLESIANTYHRARKAR